MFANQIPTRDLLFGEDPNGGRPGRGLVRAIWDRVQGLRTHPYAPEKSDPSTTFNGVSVAPQDFTGLAMVAAGVEPYHDGGSAMLDSGLVQGPLVDPARRIFAQRLARRGASGGSS